MSEQPDDLETADSSDGMPAALLRAVREEVAAYGVRRATAASIARRAGISRATVYRRGGGMPRLILDALTADYVELFEEVRAEAGRWTGRERVVETCVAMIRRVRTDPFLAAVVRHDPELLVTYLVDRLGSSQQLLLAGVVEGISAGQGDGSIRAGDPQRMGLVLLQALTPFGIGAGVLGDLADPEEAAAEVRVLVEGYLVAAS